MNSFARRSAPNTGGLEMAEVLRAALRYLPTRVVPALFGLAATPILTKTLGAAEFGRYSLLVLVATYASVVFGEWISAGYQRFILSSDPAERQAAEEALPSAVVLLAAGTAMTAVAVVVTSAALRQVMAVVLTTWAFTLFQLLVTRFIMAERVAAATWLQVGVTLVRFLVLVTVAIAVSTAEGVVAATGAALLVLCLVILARDQAQVRRPHASSVRRLMRFGGFMIVTSLAMNGLATIDRFLLALLTDAASVGKYAASYLLAEQAVLTLPSVLLIAITPRVTALWETQRQVEAGQLATRIALLHLELSVPVVVALAIFGHELSYLIFGDEFADAFVPPVIGLSALAATVASYANFGHRMLKTTRRQATQSLVGVIFNVAGVVALVPILGIAGAALATLASYLTVVGLAIRQNAWFIDVRDLAVGTFHISVPAIILFSASILSREPLWLAAGAATYTAVVVRRVVRDVRAVLRAS